MDCLGIPLIRLKIFEHFSSTELLNKLSLVNKLWNYKARKLIRKRGDLSGNLKALSPCRDIDDFASDLRGMNVVPFSGIKIVLPEDHAKTSDYCPSKIYTPKVNGVLDPSSSLRVVLDRLQRGQLTFVLEGSWRSSKCCTAFRLAARVLQNYGWLLEKLSIQLNYYGLEDFEEKVLQGCNFPRLKYLRLGQRGAYGSERGTRDLMIALLVRAPNLQVFHSPWYLNLASLSCLPLKA